MGDVGIQLSANWVCVQLKRRRHRGCTRGVVRGPKKMMRGTASMDMEALPQRGSADLRTIRQRPLSQMFSPKSLEQLFGFSSRQTGDASSADVGASSSPPRYPEALSASGGGILIQRLNNHHIGDEGADEQPGPGASPPHHNNKRNRLSLRLARSPRSAVETLRQQQLLQQQHGEEEEQQQAGGTTTATGRTRSFTAGPGTAGAGLADSGDAVARGHMRKRSSSRIGRVLGDVGKGMSNAMSSIPTPRSGSQRGERDRVDTNGKKAELQPASDDSEWEKKRASLTGAKAKMGNLLHSMDRSLRKRSVGGASNKDVSKDDAQNDQNGKGGDDDDKQARMLRAKSVTDLYKVSPIAKRRVNNTVGKADAKKIVHDENTSNKDLLRGDSRAAVEPTYNVFGGTLEEVMSFQVLLFLCFRSLITSMCSIAHMTLVDRRTSAIWTFQ